MQAIGAAAVLQGVPRRRSGRRLRKAGVDALLVAERWIENNCRADFFDWRAAASQPRDQRS